MDLWFSEFHTPDAKFSIKVKEHLVTDKVADLYHYREQIQPLLEEEICCRYYYQEGRLKSMIRDDNQLEKALEALKKEK